jgi:hypothetical protein
MRSFITSAVSRLVFLHASSRPSWYSTPPPFAGILLPLGSRLSTSPSLNRPVVTRSVWTDRSWQIHRYPAPFSNARRVGPAQDGVTRVVWPDAMEMNAPAAIVHLGLLFITVPNLIVLGLIVVVFAAALGLPFPHQAEQLEDEQAHGQ